MSGRRRGPARRGKGGLVGQALKVAREMDQRRTEARDAEAAAIAERVYAIAIQDKNAVPFNAPLAIYAPLALVAERSALAIAREHHLPETEEFVSALAAYFLSGLFNMVHGFNLGHFENWAAGRIKSMQEDILEGRGEDAGPAAYGAGEGERGPGTGQAGEEGPQGGADEPRGGPE